jgi:threonine/homoserine/homoserine lactone efflux protein
MADLWIFVGALAVAYLVPGPDMILLLDTGARQGRNHALATVIGLALARAVHVTLAVLGLAALLKTAAWAFEIVRIFGVAYLIWIGISIFRSSSLTPQHGTSTANAKPGGYFGAILRGLVTNISNPKALLFCSVLLPQFVHPELGNVGGQFLLLGSILVSVGIGFDCFYAVAGSTLGRFLARHRKAATAQRWVFTTLLIGFAMKLAVTQGPQ